jgi:hypothetical protein
MQYYNIIIIIYINMQILDTINSLISFIQMSPITHVVKIVFFIYIKITKIIIFITLRLLGVYQTKHT